MQEIKFQAQVQVLRSRLKRGSKAQFASILLKEVKKPTQKG